jgi:hypothetical protein
MNVEQEDPEAAAAREAVRQEQERVRSRVLSDQERRNARDTIYERVRAGLLSPEDGDAEAVRNGLEAFQSRPEPDAFDPMRVSHWTLSMALAWIIWRTPDAVRLHWDEYRVECREWGVWQERVGRDLGPLPPVCHWDLVLRFELEPERAIRTPNEAEAELRELLQSERLPSDGVNVKTGDREPLPGRGWCGVFAIVDHAQGFRVRGGSAAYDDVRVPREDLLHAIVAPPAASALPSEPEPSEGAEPVPTEQKAARRPPIDIEQGDGRIVAVRQLRPDQKAARDAAIDGLRKIDAAIRALKAENALPIKNGRISINRLAQLVTERIQSCPFPIRRLHDILNGKDAIANEVTEPDGDCVPPVRRFWPVAAPDPQQ